MIIINKDKFYEDIIWYYEPIETMMVSNQQQYKYRYKSSTNCSVTHLTSKVIITNYTSEAIVPLSKFVKYHDIPLMVQTTSNDNQDKPYATCQFMKYQFAGHLPHYMQQLFRCWSFWLQYKETHTPVYLYFPKKSLPYRRAMVRPFTLGLVAKMLPKLGVQVIGKVPNDKNVTNINPSIAKSNSGPNYKDVSVLTIGPLHFPEHVSYQATSTYDMNLLRHLVLQVITSDSSNKTSAATSQPLEFAATDHNNYDEAIASGCVIVDEKNDGQRSRRTIPRIAIINRKHNRRIMNSQDIIQDMIQSSDLDSIHDIPEIFFEGKSFEQQVIEMSNIDILITPHGAQETGIIFQPTCGSVFE